MKYFISTALSFFILFSSQAFAGAGHDHGHGHSHAPVSKQEAEKIAKDSVSKLVERKTIDSSWAGVAAQRSEQKEYGGRMEWVVVFNNEKVSDPEKQALYIFLTLDGQYVAANYTGT